MKIRELHEQLEKIMDMDPNGENREVMFGTDEGQPVYINGGILGFDSKLKIPILMLAPASMKDIGLW